MKEAGKSSGGINSLPSFEDRKQMWDTLKFVPITDGFPHTKIYIDALRRVYVNGDVRFGAFGIPVHDVFDWYLSRNQVHNLGFFEHFWQSPVVYQEFPYKLKDYNAYSVDVFAWSNPFILGGELACTLSYGGAYQRHANGPVHAKTLGDAVALEWIGEDYDDVLVYTGHHFAWSEFFLDVAWDCTWVAINKKRRHIYVIIATDTD